MLIRLVFTNDLLGYFREVTPDSLGNEASTAIDDWIELGIYAKDVNGKENLVLFKKVKINKEQATLKLSVPQKPASIVLDPHLRLIDKNMTDNGKSFDNL